MKDNYKLENLKMRIIYYLDHMETIGRGRIKKVINEDIDWYLSLKDESTVADQKL